MKAGGTASVESVPGLHKCLKIPALPTIFLCGKVSMGPALDEDDDPQITIDLSSLTDSGT
jgi:hypothetical protein